MADIPIIFSAPMVRALVREIEHPGTGKTQTRRLPHDKRGKPTPWLRLWEAWQRGEQQHRLWVRESFATAWFDGGVHAYMADWRRGNEQYHHEPKWKPSIHMPRHVSRLTLVVTATKIERLQNITAADAKLEGAFKRDDTGEWTMDGESTYDNPLAAFCWLWRGLHGAASWDGNPEVIAISFTPHLANIDQMQAAA